MEKSKREQIKARAQANRQQRSVTPNDPEIKKLAKEFGCGESEAACFAGPGPAIAKPKDKKPKLDIKHSCGHTTKKGKPEEPCGPCRHEASVAESRKHKKNREEAFGKTKLKGRLPDQSNFDVKYKAETKMWEGALIVDAEGEIKTFEGSHTNLFKLLVKLDDRFREWDAVGRVPKAEASDTLRITVEKSEEKPE